jgi:hypothetical protein
LYEKNSSFDEWYDIFKNQILHELNEFLKFYEEKGIKTKILTWEDDLLGKIKILTFNNLACIYKKKKKFGIALRAVSFALEIE